MTLFPTTSSLDLAPEPTPNRRPAIAATVDAGLAGLLSAVLANQRGQNIAQPEVELDETTEAVSFAVQPDTHAESAPESDGMFEDGGSIDGEGLFEVDAVDELEEAEEVDEEDLFDTVSDGLFEGETDALFEVVSEAPVELLSEAPSFGSEELAVISSEANELLDEAEGLFGDADDEGLFDDPEQGLFGEVEEVEVEGEVEDDALFGADGDEFAGTPVWAAVAPPGPLPEVQNVTHVVVHHVVESAPDNHLVSASAAPKLGRFGPGATFQSTAAESGPAPMLRHATDDTDVEYSTNEPYSFDSQPKFVPEAMTPQVAAELDNSAHRSAALHSTAPDFTNNPVFRHGVMPTPQVVVPPPAPPKPAPVARILSPLQVNLLIEGLAQVHARPGEEGLPPGVLLMDVRGPLGRYQNDNLYTIRSQIDGAVRGGDMALVVPDLGIVLFCGGLFFPGDLEVMGSRLRRRALDANPSVSPADALKVTVAGALAIPGEDAVDFVKRGVAAFDQSIDDSREDIVVDYADPRRPRV